MNITMIIGRVLEGRGIIIKSLRHPAAFLESDQSIQ